MPVKVDLIASAARYQRSFIPFGYHLNAARSLPDIVHLSDTGTYVF